MSDLMDITKFVNDVATIIYTHNGMDYELYKAMNGLKQSGDELRKMLAKELGEEKSSPVLSKMSAYYYPETLKILRTFFDYFEEMKSNAEKRQKILDTCASVEKLLKEKRQECLDSLHPIDFELSFMNQQLENDLKK